MFPLAAWEFFSVMVSFPLLAASTAKMFSVDSFTPVSFACFSARSIVNFYSEESKPLKWVKSINVMFSIRVQVASSAAWLIGSQDAHIKVNARRASIISQSACSQNFEKPKWLFEPEYLVLAHSAAVLHYCLRLWLDDKIRMSIFSWRSWTSFKKTANVCSSASADTKRRTVRRLAVSPLSTQATQVDQHLQSTSDLQR